MIQNVLAGMVLVLGIGIGAEWLAWRLRVPSILALLLSGFIVGPLLGVLDPDALFGRELVFAFVSIAVSLILFEGALTLRFREFRHVGGTVLRLISVGLLVTWVVAALAAWRLAGVEPAYAILVGAIVSVTGPTVIGPLLRHVRPKGRTGPILKWEGILIDPVGATLAVLTFEAIRHGSTSGAPMDVLLGVLHSFGAGAGVGLVAAALLAFVLWRRQVPDYLQSPATLAVVVAAAQAANHIHAESGLLAVTTMGVALANQRFVPVRHILEFKENLKVLLISTLFILLASRLELATVRALTWGSLGFLVALLLVARPLSVFVSTLGMGLPWKERLFLAWVAPRGIVAAAVASVFSLELGGRAAAETGAGALVPLVFTAIVGTVLVYGLTAAPLARRLGLAHRDPQGTLIVGANPLGCAVGKALLDEGFPVLLADSNYANVQNARMQGLPVWHGNALADDAFEDVDVSAIGRLLALTPNEQTNSLIALRHRELFERANTFQLVPAPPRPGNEPRATPPTTPGASEGSERGAPEHLRGARLFAPDASYPELSRRIADGHVVKATPLTDKFGFDAVKVHYGGALLPLFVVANGKVSPITVERKSTPSPGQTLIALVPPHTEPVAARQAAAAR